MLLVEQNAELALTLATRGYVIETGSIVLADSSDRLLENPKVWASYLGEQDWELDIADDDPAQAANT
jgi:branched-chain amino acid transport system ATP-binding protein